MNPSPKKKARTVASKSVPTDPHKYRGLSLKGLQRLADGTTGNMLSLWRNVFAPEVLPENWTVEISSVPPFTRVYTNTATGKKMQTDNQPHPRDLPPGRYGSVLDRWGDSGVWAAHHDEVGAATHLLSYPWRMSFREVIQAVSDALADTPGVYVFFDILQDGAIHSSANIFNQPEGLEDAMRHIGRVVQVSAVWNDPDRLKRIWMLMECCIAMVNDLPMTLAMLAGERTKMCEALIQEGPSAILEMVFATSLDMSQVQAAVTTDKTQLTTFVAALLERGGGS